MAKPSITNLQRRTLFALARERGMDLAAVRDLTPAGSVSSLTRTEADELIDRLSVGITTRRRRPHRGRRASAAQVRFIQELIRSTGVGPRWLERFGVRGVAEIRDAGTAKKIIVGLCAIQKARSGPNRRTLPRASRSKQIPLTLSKKLSKIKNCTKAGETERKSNDAILSIGSPNQQTANELRPSVHVRCLYGSALGVKRSQVRILSPRVGCTSSTFYAVK